MRYLFLTLVLSLFACTTTAPPQQAEPGDPSVVVRADALARMLGEPGVVVLHVARSRSDYDAGHIPGAHFLPLARVATNRDGLVNVLPQMDTLGAALRAVAVSPGSRVVLYGDLGGLAAARGFFALDATGHGGAAILDGGLAAWQQAGGAIATTSTPHPEPGTFVPRLDARRLATAAEVAALLDDSDATLVDARPFEQYTGQVPGEDVERPGHIPGAASHFWQEDLGDDGTLRPLPALRARYADAGARQGPRVVAYCRTGMQASHTYLVARLLGLDVTLYDGSYLEWSNRTPYPVEL